MAKTATVFVGSDGEVLPAGPAQVTVQQPSTPAKAVESPMSILTTIEKDINIAEVWISSISSKVKALFTKAEVLAPSVAAGISDLVTKTETFLSAATPAVAGEGLNFPSDSVAYAAFTDLVAEFQSFAGVIKTDIKSL